MASPKNYQHRIEQLQNKLKLENLDAIIIHNLTNILYLCGFKGSYGVLIVEQNDALFITDGRYTEIAEGMVKGARVITQPMSGVDDYFTKLFEEKKYAHLGFEGNLSYQEFKQLDRRLKPSKTQLVEENAAIRELRIIKDEEEIAIIQKAADLADKMMALAYESIKPGMTELELSKIIRRASEDLGGQGESFTNIVASGPNSSRPHHSPSERKFQDGDMITIDLGAVVDGYCSDMTRNPVLGKLDPKFDEIYHVCLEAQQTALKACTDGAQGKDMDAIAREIISKAGYGQYFNHGLGHGVGLEIHEAPRLGSSSIDTLKEGMVVTVEPGIYIPGFGGVRIEDLIVVTKDQPRVLSKTKLSLHQIPL